MGRLENLMKKERYPFLSLILSIFVIYYKVLAGQLWMKWDMYMAIFPTFFSISEHLKNGMLPLWEFFANRGIPLSHVIGIPIWSPLTLAFSLFGINQYAMQIYYFIIILFSAIFMYIALKTYTNNYWLCAIGSIAYASSGFFISNAQHATFISAAAIYPLIHFSYRKLLRSFKLEYSICLGVSMGLLILNSYPPFLIFTTIYLLIETLINFKAIKSNFRSFSIQVLIAIIVAISSSFVTIYTTLDIMREITREAIPWDIATSSSLNFMNWFALLTPGLAHLAKTINPPLDISMDNVYLSLPLLLPLFVSFKKNRKILMTYSLVLFSILLSMGKNGYVYRIFYEYIPGVAAFKFPAGLRYFYFFFVIIASIVSLNELIDKNKIEILQKPTVVFMQIFTSLAIIVVFLQYIYGTNISLPRYFLLELIISMILLILILKTINTHKFAIIYFIIVVLFSGQAIERNGPHTLGALERPYSFNNEVQQVYKSDGNIENSFITANTELSNDAIFHRKFQNQGYMGSFKLKEFQVASNNSQLPKEGDPAVWFTNKPIQELNNYKSVETPGIIPSTVNVLGNRISFEIDNNEPGIIIFNQTYFPGWKVQVNGVDKNIIKFSDGTMGVTIEPAQKNNNIVFEFKPIKVIISFWITFGIWIILLLYFIYFGYSKFRQTKVRKREVSS